jgi:hypothetical protein
MHTLAGMFSVDLGGADPAGLARVQAQIADLQRSLPGTLC